ncbi:MAG: hypothetical protein ACOX3X_04495 [Eubacteriales bacterium]|jgi:hypothetical protein
MSSFEQILIAFIVGVTFSAVYTYYVKAVLGSLVRGLFERNAFDEASAVTIEEAGCKNSIFLKYSLRPGTDFSETVRSVNGKYYIPEDKIDKAENKYKSEGITVFVVLLTILAFAIITLVCIYVFPELYNLVRSI